MLYMYISMYCVHICMRMIGKKTHSVRFVKHLVSGMSENTNHRVKTNLQYKTQLAGLKYVVRLEKSKKKKFEQSCGVQGGTHYLEPQF